MFFLCAELNDTAIAVSDRNKIAKLDPSLGDSLARIFRILYERLAWLASVPRYLLPLGGYLRAGRFRDKVSSVRGRAHVVETADLCRWRGAPTNILASGRFKWPRGGRARTLSLASI